MASQTTRRVVGTLCSVLVAMVSVTALASPAQAEDGYQYWHYFHLDGDAWAFAETGPADHQPTEGDVEGFRFGTSTMSQPIEPRADLAEVTFDAVCEGTEAAAGEKRVALVLDFGTEDGDGTPPEPRAECATGPEAASTQELLESVADLRVEDGMVCAVDGYPATGCGDPVADAQVPTEEEPVAFALASDETSEDEGTTDAGAEDSTGSGLLWPLVGVALLVVLVAVGALLMRRRNTAA